MNYYLFLKVIKFEIILVFHFNSILKYDDIIKNYTVYIKTINNDIIILFYLSQRLPVFSQTHISFLKISASSRL